jgi:GT2 family glycosyltransferase
MTTARPTGVPTVSVVVLSFNRPALLERALQSIVTQTYPGFDVIVVDNHSESSDRIRSLVSGFTGVQLIANEHNAGFTGGMNGGLTAATGDYVYLTEDDIELAPDCLEQLIGHLERHPDVALAGPVMWNRHTPTIRCAGGDFALTPVFQMRIVGADMPSLPATEPFSTMFLPGAAIAARTSMLRKLGGFRLDFFMYREDVELCSRVLERGSTIAVVPAARVYHHEPQAAPDSALLAFHKHKNLAALYLLHAPLIVLPMYLIRYAAIDGLRRLISDRSLFLAWFRAWVWVAASAPRLFTERATRQGA